MITTIVATVFAAMVGIGIVPGTTASLADAAPCPHFATIQKGSDYLLSLSQQKEPVRYSTALAYLRFVQRRYQDDVSPQRQQIADVLADILAIHDQQAPGLYSGCTNKGIHTPQEEYIGGRAVVTGTLIEETVPERFCHPECESEMVTRVVLDAIEWTDTDRPSSLGIGCYTQGKDAIEGVLVTDLSLSYDTTVFPRIEQNVVVNDIPQQYRIFVAPHRRIPTDTHPCSTQLQSITAIE